MRANHRCTDEKRFLEESYLAYPDDLAHRCIVHHGSTKRVLLLLTHTLLHTGHYYSRRSVQYWLHERAGQDNGNQDSCDGKIPFITYEQEETKKDRIALTVRLLSQYSPLRQYR